ncbi:MAG: 5'-nucleotidase C-terminal domain-containing protein [Rhizobiales bacterium]|nr:5'-nucleotidase C-terminal domain-containing protein [Hyphomicrobiales bacterium]
MRAHFSFIRAMALANALAAFSLPAFAVADLVLKRDLDTKSDVTCSSETAFGNFVADAVKKSQGAELAILSCSVITGNRTIAQGTTFDATAAAAEVSADARSIQIEATGMQLLEALEQALASAPAASATFPQVAGVRLVIDLGKPAGQRIVKLTVNGAALDFQKTYRVALNEDMAKSLSALASARRIEGQAMPVAADVSAHLQQVGVRDIKVLGRIKTIN